MMKIVIGTMLLLAGELFSVPTPITLPLQSGAIQMRTSPVAVGEMAPDFTLQDQQGRKVTLSDARGQSPVVLVFYRGYW